MYFIPSHTCSGFLFLFLFDPIYTFLPQEVKKIYDTFFHNKSYHFPQTNLAAHYNLPLTQVCFLDKTLKNTR